MRQARRIDHTQMKQEPSKEFTRRVGRILKTSLNGKNMVKGVNTYAVTVLCYSFGIVKLIKTYIKGLQRNVRVLMTKERKHHPRSAAERIILSKYMGGRGFVDISNQLCR